MQALYQCMETQSCYSVILLIASWEDRKNTLFSKQKVDHYIYILSRQNAKISQFSNVLVLLTRNRVHAFIPINTIFVKWVKKEEAYPYFVNEEIKIH